MSSNPTFQHSENPDATALGMSSAKPTADIHTLRTGARLQEKREL